MMFGSLDENKMAKIRCVCMCVFKTKITKTIVTIFDFDANQKQKNGLIQVVGVFWGGVKFTHLHETATTILINLSGSEIFSFSLTNLFSFYSLYFAKIFSNGRAPAGSHSNNLSHIHLIFFLRSFLFTTEIFFKKMHMKQKWQQNKNLKSVDIYSELF